MVAPPGRLLAIVAAILAVVAAMLSIMATVAAIGYCGGYCLLWRL